jgi:KaiC/GvpD/RAD55 family RecA-like ATPase
MRVSSGVFGLDKLLSGGFPENSVVLIFGPPGTGKSTFTTEFIATGLRQNEKCIFITTMESPEVLEKKLDLFDVTPTQRKNVIFIDCYSWRISKAPAKYGVRSLDLTQLSIEFKRAMKENNFQNGRVVLDSLSDFLLYVEERSVFMFLQMLVGEIKKSSSVGLVNLEEGLHTEKQVSTINYITDGLISLEMKDKERVLKIQRMAQTEHPLEWVKFEIAKGVELSIQEFFR